MEKLLVILDLDETLIHATHIPVKNNKWDFEIDKYKVYKRPFLDEFLSDLSKYFKVAIWSSASDDYVKEIVEHIFPKDYELCFVWGRSKCTLQYDYSSLEFGYSDYQNHLNYSKILKKVKKKGFSSLERMVIIDDTPKKCKQNYGNAIYPPEFTGDVTDDELKILLKFLLMLKNEPNVLKIEKRNYQILLEK